MTTQIKKQQLADKSVISSKLDVLTTKGDIMVFSNIHDKLPVGTNNQVLSVDDTSPSGLKWKNNKLYSNSTIPEGNTIISSLIETNFASSCSLNTLQAGQVLRLTASGVFTTLVASNLTLKIKLNNIVLNTTSAMVLAKNLTNIGWRIQQEILILNDGTIDCQGIAFFPTSSLLTNSSTLNVQMPGLLQISAIWGVLNIGNKITLRQFIVENL